LKPITETYDGDDDYGDEILLYLNDRYNCISLISNHLDIIY
jgi:hypothetical protein